MLVYADIKPDKKYFKLTIKAFSIVITALLFIAITSCEYEPHSVYERNLDRNVTPPEIETVNLDLSPDKDTVELIYNRVYFNFKSSNQEVRWVEFYLDDSLIGTAESGNNYFDLHYEFLYEGTHRLKLQLFTYSGTGSIADKLGYEGFLFATKEWVIKVNNTVYANVTSTDKDGFLQLRWPQPYDSINEYIVYRSGREIGRTATCDFIDKGYVGEGAEYSVKYINTTNGEMSDLGFVRIPNEMKCKYTADANNNYAITWEKLRYYAAVDSMIVTSYDVHGYSAYTIDKTTDINRTSFEIPRSLFGQLRQYRIVLTPKYPNPLYNPSQDPYRIFTSPRIECMIGYPSPIFTNFNRISTNGFIYHTYLYDYSSTAHNDSMFRYSTTENRILDRYRYNPPNYGWSGDHYWNPTTSPDGSFFSAVVGFTQTAIVGSPYSFNTYKIIDISGMTSSTMKIPVSDKGTGLVVGNYKIYLYDFKNDRLLGSFDNATAFYDQNISSDGKYFFFSVTHTIWIYSYINNVITLEKTLTSWTNTGYHYFNFMANDPDKAVGWNKDSKIFTIYQCPDMAIIKSFNVNEDQILDIDYSTNRILSFSPKLLVVRSLIDGTILYSVPVGFPTIVLNGCYLAGNSIFDQQGARYFLK